MRNMYLGKHKADEIEREKSMSSPLKDTSKNKNNMGCTYLCQALYQVSSGSQCYLAKIPASQVSFPLSFYRLGNYLSEIILFTVIYIDLYYHSTFI